MSGNALHDAFHKLTVVMAELLGNMPPHTAACPAEKGAWWLPQGARNHRNHTDGGAGQNVVSESGQEPGVGSHAHAQGTWQKSGETPCAPLEWHGALPVFGMEEASAFFSSQAGIEVEALPQDLQRGFIVFPEAGMGSGAYGVVENPKEDSQKESGQGEGGKGDGGKGDDGKGKCGKGKGGKGAEAESFGGGEAPNDYAVALRGQGYSSTLGTRREEKLWGGSGQELSGGQPLEMLAGAGPHVQDAGEKRGQKTCGFLGKEGKQTASACAKAGQHPSVALAFSGGLDSRLLAVLLQRLGITPLLFHVFGPHSIVGESLSALRRAHGMGGVVICLPMNPLEIAEVRANGQQRCYYCKRELFRRIRRLSSLPICDGTLASDFREYRPGLRALREHGVLSPLALAGFDKELVGRAALAVGLECPHQVSQSCLLTRFGYGVSISDETLRNLAVADVVTKRYLERYCGSLAWRAPHQSLRLLADDMLVLHLEGLELPLPLQEELRTLVKEAAPALPPLRIERVERVKGFFDREKK